jgi:hypothetical protein
VKKTIVELMVQDKHFYEARRHERHTSNNTLQTAKNSTTPVPTSADVKLPPKSVLPRNFFTSLRTTDMGMETTVEENA